MDFLAQVPQSPRDQGPENAEKPKNVGQKIIVYVQFIAITLISTGSHKTE